MKVLLEYCFDHYSARTIYGAVAWWLRLHGMRVDVVRRVQARDLSDYDLLVSRDYVDGRFDIEPRLGIWGGRAMTRPASLELVEQKGIPVMRWARARDRAEVSALFDRWNAERLLLKISGSRKGEGVSAFDRAHVDRVTWNPEDDLFCADVNADDGDVYKAEIFNGRIILTWHSHRPPLREGFEGYRAPTKGALSNRRLFRFPVPMQDGFRALSAELTRRGVGYCSVDLMRDPGGQLVVIELNTGHVASWWSVRFPQTSWNYARAVHALVGARARA